MIETTKKRKIKGKCKLGIHSFEHIFVPYADQPFAYDEECCVEGYHTLGCRKCGVERNMRIAGKLANTPFIRRHEKIFSKLNRREQDFVFHTMYSSKFSNTLKYLEKEKGEMYTKRIKFAKMLCFIPVYWFAPKK